MALSFCTLLSLHYFISEAKYELYFMTTVLAIQIFLSVKSMSKCSSNYNLSPTAASVLVICSYPSYDPPSPNLILSPSSLLIPVDHILQVPSLSGLMEDWDKERYHQENREQRKGKLICLVLTTSLL